MTIRHTPSLQSCGSSIGFVGHPFTSKHKMVGYLNRHTHMGSLQRLSTKDPRYVGRLYDTYRVGHKIFIT